MLKKALIVIVCFNLFIGVCYSQYFDISDIFSEFSKSGRISLVISNVGATTKSERHLEIIFKEIIENNIGVKNLYLLNSDFRKIPFVALYSEDSNRLLYIDTSGIRSTLELSLESILKNPEEWNKMIAKRTFNGNEYSIISVVLLHKNLPYELKRAVELHDHICPGLIAGYFISDFLKSKLKEEYRIIVFAVPPFCKDDAFQIIFNNTVGKRQILSRSLTADEKKLFPNLAGIYVFWNEKKKRGNGIILDLNMSEMKRKARVDEKDYPWLWRLKLNDWMLKNPDEVLREIKIIKEFDVDEAKLEKMKTFDFKLNEL